MRLFHELSALLVSLRDAGIPVIYLKGAHLAQVVYENIALRPMGDIDLLVRKEDIEKASETLIRLGYTPESHLNIQEMVKIGNHLPRFVKADGPVLEIHWNLEVPTYPLTIDVEKLWARAEKTSINGVETLILSPEDLLLHLCVHVSLHHGLEGGLKGLYDISEAIDYFGRDLDWGQLADRSRAWGAGRIVYITLLLADKILGLAVPEKILGTLEPDSPDRQAMITLAEEIVFANPAPITSNMARLWGNIGRFDKLVVFMKSVFPSRGVMSTIYPVSANSLRVYLYYPLRIKDLFLRYGSSIKQFFSPDREFLNVTDVKNKGKYIERLAVAGCFFYKKVTA